ncbi:GNAT family N-acetyltransferase [Paenibacillus sp. NFR01]|uniref:GNAT family N-acetyltransferase n=1 Tax=Paenibacillus sp. NFR01 TaxID=1566279 RepID=UPI0008B6EAD5|nr:GNAT family N-acetyltransferase [Paenibacillus sp. NFR01]SET37301.1 phosphinothricin acetyltransferase [Paenibacillus sp. NFR01]
MTEREQPVFMALGEEHLKETLEIYNYYVRNTTVSFHTEELSLEEMRQSALSGDPRFAAYAIMQGGAMAGYVLIAKHKNKQAYDTSGEISIYLKPDFSGQGIGGKALAFIEAQAAKQGFHTLVATVCTDNEPSRKLFARRGYEQSALFREIGRKFGRWLDIASFQKIIG